MACSLSQRFDDFLAAWDSSESQVPIDFFVTNRLQLQQLTPNKPEVTTFSKPVFIEAILWNAFTRLRDSVTPERTHCKLSDLKFISAALKSCPDESNDPALAEENKRLELSLTILLHVSKIIYDDSDRTHFTHLTFLVDNLKSLFYANARNRFELPRRLLVRLAAGEIVAYPEELRTNDRFLQNLALILSELSHDAILLAKERKQWTYENILSELRAAKLYYLHKNGFLKGCACFDGVAIMARVCGGGKSAVALKAYWVTLFCYVLAHYLVRKIAQHNNLNFFTPPRFAFLSGTSLTSQVDPESRTSASSAASSTSAAASISACSLAYNANEFGRFVEAKIFGARLDWLIVNDGDLELEELASNAILRLTVDCLHEGDTASEHIAFSDVQFGQISAISGNFVKKESIFGTFGIDFDEGEYKDFIWSANVYE